MRSSPFRHPANEPLVVIRRWQVEFCDGNHCAAALLNFFLYWHEIKLRQAEQQRRANEIAEAAGELPPHEISLIQWHTEKELAAGIVGLFSVRTVRPALQLLVAKGVVSRHKNPSPRYSFDRTGHYLVHPEVAQEWVDSRCPGEAKTAQCRQQNFRTVGTKLPHGEDDLPLQYPKTTLETTEEAVTSFPLVVMCEEIATSARPALSRQPSESSSKEPKISEEEATSSPSPPKKAKVPQERLLEIYQAYPRRVGRAAALKRLEVVVRDLGNGSRQLQDPADWLLHRVKLYAESPAIADRRAKGETAYIPHPATWLNQGRYDDDLQDWGYPYSTPPDIEVEDAKAKLRRIRWRDVDGQRVRMMCNQWGHQWQPISDEEVAEIERIAARPANV